jgi:autotransporter-associated beta strand protein
MRRQIAASIFAFVTWAIVGAYGFSYAGDWIPLWTTANLSQGRELLAAASAGGEALFGGGQVPYANSGVVDLYNTATGLWSTSSLSQARCELAAASAGTKVLFAGGTATPPPGVMASNSAVDIYDTSTGTWTVASLSVPRYDLAAASAGNLAFFAGGWESGPNIPVGTVDIYDASTGTWATASLSQARDELAATALGNQVFFAGGGGESSPSSVVDIYNTSTHAWTTASLSQPRYGPVAAAAGSDVLFAGGTPGGGTTFSSVVDIYNASSGSWSTAGLSQPRSALAAASVGSKVLFAGGFTFSGAVSAAVDIYDTSTGQWSTASLSQARCSLAATTVGNQVFFAGGLYGGPSLSNVADIYTLQSYTSITSTKTFTLQDNTTVAGLMQLNGGNLALAAYNLAVGSMGGSAPIDTGGGKLTVGSDNTSGTYSGTISGQGMLVKIGTGTLTLTASNSYSGGTTISGGALQLGDGASTNGYVTGNIANNASLVFANPSAQTFLGVVSGTGSLTKNAAGRLTLAAANTYSGVTLVSAGTLVLGNSAALQQSTLDTSGGGVVSFGGLTAATLGGLAGSGSLALNNTAALPVTLTVGNNGANTTFSGSLSGSGSLVKVGSGALTLTVSNTYSGVTNISAGGLIAGAPGVLSPFSDMIISGLLDASLHPNTVKSLNMTSGGTLDLGAGNLLASTNAATLGGTLNLSGVPSGSLVELLAYSSETGTFATVTGLPGGHALQYGATELDLVAVPEPSTLALLGAGAVGLLAFAALRARRVSPGPGHVAG